MKLHFHEISRFYKKLEISSKVEASGGPIEPESKTEGSISRKLVRGDARAKFGTTDPHAAVFHRFFGFSHAFPGVTSHLTMHFIEISQKRLQQAKQSFSQIADRSPMIR